MASYSCEYTKFSNQNMTGEGWQVAEGALVLLYSFHSKEVPGLPNLTECTCEDQSDEDDADGDSSNNQPKDNNVEEKDPNSYYG